jgi:hypothetical protein
MKRIVELLWIVCLASCTCVPLRAGCPYDHLVIGCNADGEPNTPDDWVLFLDVSHMYRRSDPNHRDQPTWLNWYYTLFPFGGDPGASTFVIGEPGFDVYHHPDEPGIYDHEDPNRCLVGIKNVDYRIIVECVDISPGFKGLINYTPVLIQVGDTFNHSALPDSHVHLQYTVPAPGNILHWIQYRVYDEFHDPDNPNSGYQPSQPITVVFGQNPVQGDIRVDRSVDILDIEKLAERWLLQSDCQIWNDRGQAAYDLFDRSDVNRDYVVDLADFALLTAHWLDR